MYLSACISFVPGGQGSAVIFASGPVGGRGSGRSQIQRLFPTSRFHSNNYYYTIEKTVWSEVNSEVAECKCWLMIALWCWGSFLTSLCASLLISAGTKSCSKVTGTCTWHKIITKNGWVAGVDLPPCSWFQEERICYFTISMIYHRCPLSVWKSFFYF